LSFVGFPKYTQPHANQGLEEAACECYSVIRQLDDNPNISPNLLR